jgi:16S rRNA C967 or C1407 C5-methylase (RsmB/RsmF family)
MAHTLTYQDLKKKTIAELRDIAKDIRHDAVLGFTQMNKEHLLPALCQALGIDAREHHVAHGEEKATAHARMHELKKKRQEVIEAGDHAALKAIRREYHHWNHKLRADARRG